MRFIKHDKSAYQALPQPDPKDDKLIEDIGAINDQPNRIDPVRPLGTGGQMEIGLGAIGRGGQHLNVPSAKEPCKSQMRNLG